MFLLTEVSDRYQIFYSVPVIEYEYIMCIQNSDNLSWYNSSFCISVLDGTMLRSNLNEIHLNVSSHACDFSIIGYLIKIILIVINLD